MLQKIKVHKREDRFTSKNFDKQIAYKYLFKLKCKNIIESAAYLHFMNGKPSNLAIDISTMVGCPMQCKFCESSMIKYVRDLNSKEIYAQVAKLIQTHSSDDIPEITCSFQGIGEPSLLPNTILHSCSDILNLDKRIIFSISTTAHNIAALQIWRNSTIPIYSLQISCSGTTTEKIRNIMPYSPRIEKIINEAFMCASSSNFTKVKINYILIKDYNDTEEDLRFIVETFKNSPIIIKISSLNKTISSKNNSLQQCSMENAKKFCTKLTAAGVNSFVYGTFNSTNVSCGQLAFLKKGGGGSR